MSALIKNSLENLKGHKLRLAIAFIWIIIGITSVVFVSAVGNGLTQLFKSNFDDIKPRTSIFYYELTNTEDNKSKNSFAYQPAFNNSDLGIIKSINGVKSAEMSNNQPAIVSAIGFDSNTYSANVSFYGKTGFTNITTPNQKKFKLLKGRDIKENDMGSRVVVIPSELSDEIFGEDVDPIGKGITINKLTFQVIGVSDSDYVFDPIDKKLRKARQSENKFNYAIIPQPSFDLLTGANVKSGPINTLIVNIDEKADIQTVNDEVLNTLRDLHPRFTGEYKVQDRSTIQKQIDELSNGIDKFVTVITIVAMILGGVGIMNIMYVSVMERNKEIGIRRALGAKSSTIMAQFLIESVFITSIGGVMGIIVGYAVTLYTQNLLPFKPIPSFGGFVYSAICIVLIGIIFGLVPAYKAAKVDPIKVIYK